MNSELAKASGQPVIHRRHPARLVTAALALLLVVWFIDVLLRNPAFEWAIVIRYIFEPSIMRGLVTTLWLTGAVTLLSVLFGTLIAAARLSPISCCKSGVGICLDFPLDASSCAIAVLVQYRLSLSENRFRLPWLTPLSRSTQGSHQPDCFCASRPDLAHDILCLGNYPWRHHGGSFRADRGC